MGCQNKVFNPSNNSLALGIIFNGTKIQVEFDGSYLMKEKVTFNYKSILNLFIVYKINLWLYGLILH